MEVFINNNDRFCYQSKEKVLSSNTLRRMHIQTRKDKNGEPYDNLEKRSSDAFDSESDKDNDECKE